MSQPFEFDPDKVAYYEKAGWQAYYDRKWLRNWRRVEEYLRQAYQAVRAVKIRSP